MHVAARRAGAGARRPRGRRPGRARAGGPLGAAARRRRRARWARRRSPSRATCRWAGTTLVADESDRRTTSMARVPLVVTPDRLELPPRGGRRPGHLGPDDPALLGAVAAVLGARRPRRPGRAGPVGRRRSWAPASCWSTRCTRRRRRVPVEPSPYLPVTRRFVSPLYIRVEEVPEYAYLTGAVRAEIERTALLQRAHERVAGADRPGRGVGGEAVGADAGARGAAQRRRGRPTTRRSCAREGAGLVDFATWCALAEVHGDDVDASGREALQDPRSPAVAAARAASSPTGSTSTAGCSGSLDEQLDAAQRRGRGGRDAARRRARPGRRRAPGRRRHLGAAGRDGPRRHASARRRTRSTSRARTGRSRRGGRTGWPRPATRRTATCCAPCCGTPAASGSTTSSGCSGSGGCRRAGRPPRAPTSGTTTRR